jgi:hypothetical protein
VSGDCVAHGAFAGRGDCPTCAAWRGLQADGLASTPWALGFVHNKALAAVGGLPACEREPYRPHVPDDARCGLCARESYPGEDWTLVEEDWRCPGCARVRGAA